MSAVSVWVKRSLGQVREQGTLPVDIVVVGFGTKMSTRAERRGLPERVYSLIDDACIEPDYNRMLLPTWYKRYILNKV